MTESAAAPHLPEFGIFLVAHTNVGKTTLIRTLLGKDVGEIEDAPDVTKAVTSYDLVVDRTAGALRLWDTPGFGDSFRLARRFRQRHRWVAWAIRECWDRAFNQKLWRGQRLVLDLRTRASVILYPVSLLERPVDAVYVAPELEIMAWVGKPVLAIFNQGVGLQSQASEVERVNEWQRHLSGFPAVRSVLRLDAYTRCWLQELALYREISHVLPETERATYSKLEAVLGQSYSNRFDASVSALSAYLLRLATDKVELEAGWFEGIKDVWTSLRKSIPWGKSKDMTPFEVAMQGLAQRYAEGTKAVTDKLIAINRLDGVSASEIVETADAKLVTDKPVDGGSSALVGGVISGILTGLGADLLTGGLTLGSGALVGGVLGAMGAAALAKGYNVYTHKNMKMVGWSGESLTEAFGKSVMLYISIAHFGRGQGQWRRKEDPTNWTIAANEVLQRDGERLKRLWAKVGAPASSQREEGECETEVRHFLREVLRHLYPESRTVLPEERFGAGKSAAQLNLPIKEKSSS
ncbi:DUF3482 domain-containing protein [Candidatus Skiveiella danica]|jgi:hypothetical protein|uniref:GTPase domain-containing protein n=1 Tax=Candidatus Skiveiella danica TaxID=3386177 RepID=UPI001E02B5F2|nr:DUF3482 domain-containing protein [Comamonadaceae bacterium]MBK6556373.1 DUF3482 domain-containing protein [Comamonadaceae bacterium]MBK9197639.1 DUF3482 domain-containing protein [Betaproteobacteria bacterium]MBK9987084.1 DUF3482 domain-containing protein [Betaproteobacteria bacterium]